MTIPMVQGKGKQNVTRTSSAGSSSCSLVVWSVSYSARTRVQADGVAAPENAVFRNFQAAGKWAVVQDRVVLTGEYVTARTNFMVNNSWGLQQHYPHWSFPFQGWISEEWGEGSFTFETDRQTHPDSHPHMCFYWSICPCIYPLNWRVKFFMSEPISFT